MNYELVELHSEPGKYVIKCSENELIKWIPFDEGNTDYQQYLIDTDGGLPLLKEAK